MDFFSAGESHGQYISGLLNGFPAGVTLDTDLIDSELKRRRFGFGRSERMTFESDSFFIESGVVDRKSIASPIFFTVKNSMGERFFDRKITENIFPRPGHVDLPSAMKYDYASVAVGAERSSARETVVQVIAGSFAKMLLRTFGVKVSSDIVSIGQNSYPLSDSDNLKRVSMISGSLGGHLKVSVTGVVPGVGSNHQWSDRLDSYIAAKIMAIPSVKGLYIGDPKQHEMFGIDAVGFIDDNFTPKDSKTGGIDGGITNGDDITVNIYLKPIPTQPVPVKTVNYLTGKEGIPESVRSDLCAVESASVVVEAALAFVIADVYTRKFGSDTLGDMKVAFDSYLKRIKWRGAS